MLRPYVFEEQPDVKRTLGLFLGFFAAFLFFTSTSFAESWIIPGGQEPVIQSLFAFKNVYFVDQERTEIQIQNDGINARLWIKPLNRNWTIQLRFPDGCEAERIAHFCVVFPPEVAGESGWRIMLLAALADADKQDPWKKMDEEASSRKMETVLEADAFKDKKPVSDQPTPRWVIAIRAGMLVSTLLSLLLIGPLALVAFLKSRQSQTLESWKIPAFWFVFALVARFALVQGVQVNAYAVPPPNDWIQGFPVHGLIFPLLMAVLQHLGLAETSILFACVKLIGAASVVLLFLVAIEWGAPRTVAYFAALFLALSPFHLRLSASDSEHIPLLFFYLLGFWGVLRFRKTGDPVFAVLTALCSLLMAQCRPEALFFPGTYLILVFFDNKWQFSLRRWRQWLIPTLFVLVLVGLLALQHFSGERSSILVNEGPDPAKWRIWFYDLLLRPLGSGIVGAEGWSVYLKDAILGSLQDFLLGHEIGRPYQNIQWFPALLTPFMIVGAMAGLRHAQGRILLLFAFCLKFPGWFLNGADGTNFYGARYFMPLFLIQALFLGEGLRLFWVAFIPEKAKWLRMLLVSAMVFSLSFSMLTPLRVIFTHQQESEFLVKAVKNLPPDASVSFLSANEFEPWLAETTLRPAWSLATWTRPDIVWMPLAPSMPDPVSGYYVELAPCKTPVDAYLLRASDIGRIGWDERKKRIGQLLERCERLRGLGGKPELSSVIDVKGFHEAFEVQPLKVEIALYEIPETPKKIVNR